MTKPIDPVTNDDPSDDVNKPETDEVVDTAAPADSDVVAATTPTDSDVVANVSDASDEAAAEQHAEDEKFRSEYPNEPLVREANPEVGGETF